MKLTVILIFNAWHNPTTNTTDSAAPVGFAFTGIHGPEIAFGIDDLSPDLDVLTRIGSSRGLGNRVTSRRNGAQPISDL
jgi:hypothetical protein